MLQRPSDVRLLGTVVWHTTRPSLATELQAKGQPVPENHKMGLQGPGTEENGTSILLSV